MPVRAQLSNRIKVAVDDIPSEAYSLIKSALSFTNEEREAAMKDRRWGWQDMPATIDLWEERDGELIMPRGFAYQLEYGLREGFDTDVVWENELSYGDDALELKGGRAVKTFNYQDRALRALWERPGLWEAPPGAGKTVTLLELIRRKGVKALVITDRVNLIEQWRKEARQHLGFEGVGFIGGGTWEEGDITIALRQSLWARIRELDVMKWWARFGLTAIDEVHHASAESLKEITLRCQSIDLIGASATTARTEVQGQIVQAIVGPLVHTTTDEELEQAGRLIKPKVIEVPTTFDFPYHSSISVGPYETCPVRNCRRPTPHGHRNNWSKMLKALLEDPERASLFSQVVQLDRDHRHLVLSRQLKHLHFLAEVLNESWSNPSDALPTYMLTSKQELDERMEIYELMELYGPAVLFTTLGDEALDIPVLDRLHLVYPVQAREGGALLRQQVGRILRVHEDKQDAIVYDYTDWNVGVLAAQASTRKTIYRSKGYAIEKRTGVTNSG